jgi:serine protease Do
MRFKICALCFAALGVAASLSFAQEAPRTGAAPGRSIYIHRAGGSYLGIGVAEIDAGRAKALHLKEVRGAEVKNVYEDSPAAKAGLKEGDVLLEYNGQRIEGAEQFVRLVRETPVDRQVSLLVWRNGATQTLTATIGSRPARRFTLRGGDDQDFAVEIPPMPPMPAMPQMPPMPEVAPPPDFPRFLGTRRSAMLGIESEGLTSQLAAFFGVKQGVLVRSVLRNSAAEKAGIRAGDVIVKVDGETVASPREISSLLRSAREKKTFPVVVVRDKKELTLSVTLDAGGDEPGVRIKALDGPGRNVPHGDRVSL